MSWRHWRASEMLLSLGKGGIIVGSFGLDFGLGGW